MLSMDTPVIEF